MKNNTSLVVAFAFGSPQAIRSNETISAIAFDKALSVDGVVFTQKDLPIPFDTRVPVVTLPQKDPSHPPTTLLVARSAADYARKNGISLLWIAAARPHLWRCKRDLKRAAADIGICPEIRECEQIFLAAKSAWYCPDSSQSRTRSPAIWMIRESVLRLTPFWLYERAAD